MCSKLLSSKFQVKTTSPIVMFSTSQPSAGWYGARERRGESTADWDCWLDWSLTMSGPEVLYTLQGVTLRSTNNLIILHQEARWPSRLSPGEKWAGWTRCMFTQSSPAGESQFQPSLRGLTALRALGWLTGQRRDFDIYYLLFVIYYLLLTA